jgi:tRNA uridine 5-carboxymethylaminomethyl modification enzyme
MSRYDVIVIGGGHAGTEAASLAARRGARTLLLTQNLETIGQMSCNPAIGGIAKGTVVREVDALGGVMGRATDRAMIHFRMLNRSKGPAVWSPRAQCDRGLYRRAVRRELERHGRIEFCQDTVTRVLLKGDCIEAVETMSGRTLAAPAVILTTGTFLRGRIHTGLHTPVPAGRAGEPPATEIAEALHALGLEARRFKTGTPPRVDGRSVNYSRVIRQEGDPGQYWFSSFQRSPRVEQLACFLTHTTDQLREIVQSHLGDSALYGGAISSRGPRYCPSIEDKIVKFPNAARHQIFLEPEGLDTSEIYVNGLSTSLPPAVQIKLLMTVPGLEAARVTRLGYAIEYDYFPPTQLHPTLESKVVRGLFLAGQVNGTTGYEEAAAQGVVAGINAAARACDLEPIVFSRQQSFIGVLVDDLVNRGVDEPYRLFTSRSEYRLSNRQDNALRRLAPMADRLKLFDADEMRIVEAKLAKEDQIRVTADNTLLQPAAVNGLLSELGSTEVQGPTRIAELARRHEVPLGRLLAAANLEGGEALEWADIELKYAGYVARERAAAERMAQMDELRIPGHLDYTVLTALTHEAREKLERVRPMSIGQASRIPGLTPNDIQGLVAGVLRTRSNEPGLVSRETEDA